MVYFFSGFSALVWSFDKELAARRRGEARRGEADAVFWTEALTCVQEKLKECQRKLSLAVRQHLLVCTCADPLRCQHSTVGCADRITDRVLLRDTCATGPP